LREGGKGLRKRKIPQERDHEKIVREKGKKVAIELRQ